MIGLILFFISGLIIAIAFSIFVTCIQRIIENRICKSNNLTTADLIGYATHKIPSYDASSELLISKLNESVDVNYRAFAVAELIRLISEGRLSNRKILKIQKIITTILLSEDENSVVRSSAITILSTLKNHEAEDVLIGKGLIDTKNIAVKRAICLSPMLNISTSVSNKIKAIVNSAADIQLKAIFNELQR